MYKRWIPSREQILQSHGLRHVRPWLHHPFLWHFSRRRVSGAIGVGLLASMIPGPFQIITAALLAIKFRFHLPTALATTLFTNPVTILPLYWLAYRIGALILGSPPYSLAYLKQIARSDWGDLWDLLGLPWLLGMPILAVLVAGLCFAMLRLFWSWYIRRRWRVRRRDRLLRMR